MKLKTKSIVIFNIYAALSWGILFNQPVILTAQTLTSEDTKAGENMTFSELASTVDDPAKQTTDKNETADVQYTPWGCRFTLQPLDVKCGKEKIIPPAPDILKEQAELLDFLRNGKAKLDSRESEILAREKELSGLEKRVEQKINEISKINEEINQTRLQQATKETETLKQLVGYYEKIPPENAAIIFNQMDQQTATMILTRMSSRQAAAVLANLDPQVAIRITEYAASISKNREEYLNFSNYNQ